MKWARQRADQLLGFYIHLAVFVLVNAGLVAIDLATGGPGSFLGLDWAFWPIGGWGIGLAAHGLSLLSSPGRETWRDRKAKQLYDKRLRDTAA